MVRNWYGVKVDFEYYQSILWVFTNLLNNWLMELQIDLQASLCSYWITE